MSEIIGYPLGWVMWLMYQITENYAWSIVIFTLIIKIILFPLSVKQQKSSAAMAAFQPKLEKLNAQLSETNDDMKEMVAQKNLIDQEIFLLYQQEENINGQIATYSLLIADKQEELDAAKELESKGIHAEVWDLRTLVPLDFEAIKKSVSKTGRVLIVHEACERSGYGAEIAAQIADKLFDELDAPILRVCGANIPVPNATIPEVESAPTVQKIVDAVNKLCQGGKFRG